MCIRDSARTLGDAVTQLQHYSAYKILMSTSLASRIAQDKACLLYTSIWKYLDIKNGNRPKHPVTIIFGGKAAPACTIAQEMCIRDSLSVVPHIER